MGKGPTPLVKIGVVLHAYRGEEVKSKGTVEVIISYEGQLPLSLVEGESPALLVRNWLEKLRLNWPLIKQLTQLEKELEKELEDIVKNHAHYLFEGGLDTLRGQ